MMLLLFGLSMLGPSCFAPFIFGHRFRAVGPRVPRWGWSLIGAIVAWPLVAIGCLGRPELVYSVLGAAMAPGGWGDGSRLRTPSRRLAGPASRREPGGIAWRASGFVVGLVPPLAAEAGVKGLADIQPAAVLAFVVAFLLYAVLATLGSSLRLGLKSSVITEGSPDEIPGPSAGSDHSEPAIGNSGIESVPRPLAEGP